MDISLNNISKSINYNDNVNNSSGAILSKVSKQKGYKDPAIQSLSELLTTKLTEGNIYDNPIYNQISNIDAELADIEKKESLFRLGKLSLRDIETLMSRIVKVQGELLDIKDIIKRYNEVSKEKKELNKKLQSSFDQLNILKKQLEENSTKATSINSSSIR